jgi:uncharacterized membrane protein
LKEEEMGIKVKNVDKKSVLRKYFAPFVTNVTATGANLASILCPAEAEFKSISFALDGSISATAGNALHITVINDTKGATLIDYTVTGTVAVAVSASQVVTVTATALIMSSPLDLININLSASSAFGLVKGLAIFEYLEHKTK